MAVDQAMISIVHRVYCTIARQPACCICRQITHSSRKWAVMRPPLRPSHAMCSVPIQFIGIRTSTTMANLIILRLWSRESRCTTWMPWRIPATDSQATMEWKSSWSSFQVSREGDLIEIEIDHSIYSLQRKTTMPFVWPTCSPIATLRWAPWGLLGPEILRMQVEFARRTVTIVDRWSL